MASRARYHIDHLTHDARRIAQRAEWSDPDDERVITTFGENDNRLLDLNNECDPDNLFRMNQNIEPDG